MADQYKHINQMMSGTFIPYDIYQYNAIPANCHPTWRSDKVPAEATSSTFEEKDRRRKRTGKPKSGEREATTNMGSVSIRLTARRIVTDYLAEEESTKPSVSKSVSRTKGETCQRS